MPIQSKQQPPYYENIANVKTYIALLSQTGTNAPTAEILVNTIGNIIWTRQTTGNYYGTLAGAFPLNKTTFKTVPNADAQIIAMGNNEDGEPSNQIYISTATSPVGPADGILYKTSIQITIYP